MSGVFLGNLKTINIINIPLTPTSVAANTTAEQVFTVPHVAAGDVVMVIKPTAQAGLGIVNQYVPEARTVNITYSNNTGSPITPTSETYQIAVFRPELVGSNITG